VSPARGCGGCALLSAFGEFCKFAAGVVDTGGNLPPASLTPVANLPPVSTTLAKWCKNLPPMSLIPVADTGGNFAAGVVDTGGAP
jgi:hypothetical protein